MSDRDTLARARAEFEAGKGSGAVVTAWQAAQSAMLRHDEETLAAVAELANEMVESTSGRAHAEAERLAAYCRAVLDGVGGGVEAPGPVWRMFGRFRRE